MPTPFPGSDEWLEADGLGGFASGTVDGIRTRRYHALLLPATNPPSGRYVLVNGLEAWVGTPSGRFALSAQRYAPDVVHPDGGKRIERFTADPFPTWVYRLEDGTRIEHAVFVGRGRSHTVLRWRLAEPREGIVLHVRPLLSGRDYHSLHRENPAFRFEAAVEEEGRRAVWHPYQDVPAVEALTNGRYAHEPLWFRNFQYDEERARGLDFIEDLASPGEFVFRLTDGEAVLILAARRGGHPPFPDGTTAADHAARLAETEDRRRRQFPSRLHRAADAYIVDRGAGKTIVAGYPWFTDWGRDTFISMRGLCLATGRLEDARGMLLAWAGTVSDGMLPNRFPDHGDVPEFNSVDASLWYVIAVHDYFAAMSRDGQAVADADRRTLEAAVEAILTGNSRGTRYGIRQDDDGLLSAGVPGVQLTWMDAKVGDWVVTPRIGKPVEIQALWLNALWIGSRTAPHWQPVFERGRSAFLDQFWNEHDGCLFDVVDVENSRGRVDAKIRPNQLLAIGGLPRMLLDGSRARQVVDLAERRLWTPSGLRTLDPADPAYCDGYRGGVHERDGAYHQGIVWPWLIGPFVEAWLRVRGATPEARVEARRRFIDPLLAHLDEAGLGHISEIADPEPPHKPQGCPFQAWSVGEVLRVEALLQS
ncbi:MAG TPA: amylo-alpha-1,6-glucosidase [Planctomycetaceae bacterium]|nr:amylo-alpha-1,6-glucosidase [Planctomycetaceae bacterium]